MTERLTITAISPEQRHMPIGLRISPKQLRLKENAIIVLLACVRHRANLFRRHVDRIVRVRAWWRRPRILERPPLNEVWWRRGWGCGHPAKVP